MAAELDAMVVVVVFFDGDVEEGAADTEAMYVV